jgi:hypothetical protein
MSSALLSVLLVYNRRILSDIAEIQQHVMLGIYWVIVDKYGNYVRKFMWQLCAWGRVEIFLIVHNRAILKIVKSMCNGIKKMKCTPLRNK